MDPDPDLKDQLGKSFTVKHDVKKTSKKTAQPVKSQCPDTDNENGSSHICAHVIIVTYSMYLLQRVKGGMGYPYWQFDIPLQKLRGCTIVDMPESVEMTMPVDCRSNQPSLWFAFRNI